jgi:hypothetical protein
MAASALALAIVAVFATGRESRAASREMVVYKSASCGCCKEWIKHVEAAGFTVVSHDTEAMGDVKSKAGVPAALMSCHTAKIGGYVVEGHVPADLIERMLRERPAIAGLAVAGMPQGSPGMEQGQPKQDYEVRAFTADGKWTVYAKR